MHDEGQEVREVYSADDMMDAEYIRRVLAEEEISARIVGALLQDTFGFLLIESDAPGIWVRGEDYTRAKQIVDSAKSEQRERAKARQSWTCPECGEANTSAFEICWFCQKEDETLIQ